MAILDLNMLDPPIFNMGSMASVLFELDAAALSA
jgi:hypothetical protein